LYTDEKMFGSHRTFHEHKIAVSAVVLGELLSAKPHRTFS
jgi:hypothetical protein